MNLVFFEIEYRRFKSAKGITDALIPATGL